MMKELGIKGTHFKKVKEFSSSSRKKKEEYLTVGMNGMTKIFKTKLDKNRYGDGITRVYKHTHTHTHTHW